MKTTKAKQPKCESLMKKGKAMKAPAVKKPRDLGHGTFQQPHLAPKVCR